MRKLTASVFLDYSLCRRSLCMVAVTRTSEPEYDLWPSRNLRHALEDAACGKPIHVLHLVHVYQYVIHERFCDFCYHSNYLSLTHRSLIVCAWCLTNISEQKSYFMFEFPCIISLYHIKNQKDATLAVLFISHCKITLHVSDAFCVHHQEY